MKTTLTFSSPVASRMEDHPEHVKAIGMISIEIANMEGHIALWLMPLLEIDAHQARIIYFTPKASIARLEIIENLIGSLAEEHQRTVVALLNPILERARKVFSKRHTFIHNAWGFSQNEDEVVTTMLPPAGRFKSKPVPISELTAYIERIRSVATDAWNIVGKIENVLRADTSLQMFIEVGPPKSGKP